MKYSITSFLCLTASCIALAASGAHAQTTTLKKAKATTSGVSTINGNKLANPLPLPTNEYTGPGVSTEEPVVCNAVCNGIISPARTTTILSGAWGNNEVFELYNAGNPGREACAAIALVGGSNRVGGINTGFNYGCEPSGDPRHCNTIVVTSGTLSDGTPVFTGGPIIVNCPN
jgi:hypothetical protein